MPIKRNVNKANISELEKLIDSSIYRRSNIADELGIHRNSFYRILKSPGLIRVSELFLLADILKIDPNKLASICFSSVDIKELKAIIKEKQTLNDDLLT